MTGRQSVVAQTERFIRRFAKVYTPIVFGLALLVVLVPWVVSLMNSGFEYIFTKLALQGSGLLVVSCTLVLWSSVCHSPTLVVWGSSAITVCSSKVFPIYGRA